MPTIKETLTNSVLHAEFKRFLEAEYAEESLVLWNEIEAFKKLAETGATPAVSTACIVLSFLQILRIDAKRIFEKYIKCGSEYEVNLPGKLVSDLENVLYNTSIDSVMNGSLLNDVQAEARSVFEGHSFPRWLKSVEWPKRVFPCVA